jgi:hypothetical protein
MYVALPGRSAPAPCHGYQEIQARSVHHCIQTRSKFLPQFVHDAHAGIGTRRVDIPASAYRRSSLSDARAVVHKHRLRTSIGAAWRLGLAAISGPIAAHLENGPDSWHLLGHSLILWILIGLIASGHASYQQAIARTTTALIISVAGYYWSTAHVDHTANTSAQTVIFWLALALIGGPTLAVLSVTARRVAAVGIFTSFVIIGMLLGDTLNIRGGLIGLENRGVDSLIGSAPITDVSTILGIGGAAIYLLIICRRQTLSWLSSCYGTIGLMTGYLLISAPDYLLFRL